MSTHEPNPIPMHFNRRSFLKGTGATLVGTIWLSGCADDRSNATAGSAGQAATAAGGTTYWADDFAREDGAVGNGWVAHNGATAQIVGHILRLTGQGDYRLFYNPAGGSLPADYFVTATVPHSLVTSTGVFWGLLGRYAAGSGVKVMWQNGGPRAMGAGHAAYANDIAISVTGGFPSSWDQNQDHMIALQFSGANVTIYLDGQEYGRFTDATNNQAGTAVGFVGDAGGTALFNVVRIEVTDSPAIAGPVDLRVGSSVTSISSTSLSVQAVPVGGTAPYGYQWHRSTMSGFAPSAATVLSGATTQEYTDTGLTLGMTYCYRVVVTDSAGGMATSPEITALTQVLPLTIGYLSQDAATVDSIVLRCTGASGGTAPMQYQWHRATTFTQTPTWDGSTAIPSSNSLLLSDSPPVQGGIYSYVLLARDANGVLAASTPILALSYLSRLRLGVLGDVCLANFIDPLARHVPDWLQLYLRSSWGPRDVQVVSQATGAASSGYWAPGSAPYNDAVTAFRAAGVTHVFLQYCFDGNHGATDATVRQLAADGFIVLIGQHQYTTQTVNDPWDGLANGIYEEAAGIQSVANGTTILVCDMVSVRSGVAFGRHSTDPNVNYATSYIDAEDLHPSAYGIPLLAFGMAAGIANALNWRAPTS